MSAVVNLNELALAAKSLGLALVPTAELERLRLADKVAETCTSGLGYGATPERDAAFWGALAAYRAAKAKEGT